MTNYTPLQVAVALSLYAYNVDSVTRAKAIYQHFDGECLEMEELIALFEKNRAWICTELPAPSAAVYVQQALARYGDEAVRRTRSGL